jgi:heme/copper-type cytochrome/quinol oxidase subunit 2
MVERTRINQHFTTRRGFVAATGFGVVGLYFLWAGYGAAPLSFGGHGEHEGGAGGGHGGHGAAGAGPSTAEFRQLTEAFVAAHALPDGSVQPRRLAASAQSAGDDHAAHHGGGTAAESSLTGPGDPVDVYLMAYRWGYTPAILRLEAGVPYRFRMMSIDVAHGASLQLGRGGRMIRLRPGALVEQELTFTRPGEYLLYCTVYCGLPHDRMQGRIIVSPREARS